MSGIPHVGPEFARFEPVNVEEFEQIRDAVAEDIRNLANLVAQRADDSIADALIRMAYVQAVRAGHEGGRVEISLGSAILDNLQKRCTIPTLTDDTTLWGFPVYKAAEHLGPAHVSVHVVHTITLRDTLD